ISENRKVLTPKGRFVMIGGGGATEQGLFGVMLRPLRAMVLSKFSDQQMGMMMADSNQKDLALLAEWVQSGKLKPVIDRTYKLSDIQQAIAYVEEGHARGKVIVTVD